MTDFTPLYATNDSASIARFIAAQYPLALPHDCRMLNRGFNDVYAIIAATGEHYVFRLSHHRVRGAADVRTETDFVAYLDQAGVPVAAPVRTREGALFTAARSAEGLRECVLFRHLEGRAPQMDSVTDARANGRTLAQLHNAAENYRAADPLYRLDLDHLLHRPLLRILDFQKALGGASSNEIAEVAARTAERIENFASLTWTHCHGDCHGFNARITATNEAAFFDFDDSGPGYLAYDLAVFLWAKVSFGRNLHAVWDAFIDGYRSVRPITTADFEAAHAFVIVRHLWVMGEHASRAREWGSDPVQWITREAAFLKAWESDRVANRLV